jgi:hypothetical protein
MNLFERHTGTQDPPYTIQPLDDKLVECCMILHWMTLANLKLLVDVVRTLDGAFLELTYTSHDDSVFF